MIGCVTGMAGRQICLCGGAPTGIRTNGDWSRVHGWTLPLHPLQGVAFLFLAMFALLHFGVLVPSLPHHSFWKLAAAVVISVVFIVHVLVLLVCMSLNPGDPSVRSNVGAPPGSSAFDRSKRPHVILDQYCCICQVKVGIKSKHCSACNKCISDFDHHCKWLNNCIGGRNYKLFLVCVSSALIGCFVIFITSLSLVTAYFFKDSWLNQPLSMRVFENSTKMTFSDPPTNTSSNTSHPSPPHFREGRVFWVFLPVTGSLWLLVVVMTAILSFMACALLAHLLIFHLYLISQGLSTYEYIVQKREMTRSSGQTGHLGSYGGRGTGGQLVKKGLLCPLKKWRHFKMANQILPVSNKEEHKQMDTEMAASKNSVSLQNVKARDPDKSTAVEERDGDASLDSPVEADRQTPEQRAGDIYLGSPLRRARNLLPPIGRSDFPGNRPDTILGKNQRTLDNEDRTSFPIKDAEKEESPVKERSFSSLATSSLPSLVEPEEACSEPPPPSAIQLCSRHLSVSTQSLNSVTKDESSLDDPSDVPGTTSHQRTLDSQAHLGGSLSNLLILDGSPLSDEKDDDDDDDDLSVEDVVHEVRIVQSPYRQSKNDHLLFCPGKRRLGSLSRQSGCSLGDLSTSQQDDVSVSDMCALDPNFAEETTCVSSLSKRRPSVDVLLIPLGTESSTRNSYNESTVVVLQSDCETRPNLFTTRRTNFLNESSHYIRQQLIV